MAQQETPSFLEEFDGSDIILMIEGTPVHAVKSVLCLWSPVFKAMLTNDFLEKQQNCIQLPGKDIETVVELMKLLHPPNSLNLLELSVPQVCDLIPVVHEYQISSLLKKLEALLVTAPCDLAYISMADHYGLKELYDINVEVACKMSYADIANNPAFPTLKAEVCSKILMAVLKKQHVHVQELEKEHLTQAEQILDLKRKLHSVEAKVDSLTKYRHFGKDAASTLQKFCRKSTEFRNVASGSTGTGTGTGPTGAAEQEFKNNATAIECIKEIIHKYTILLKPHVHPVLRQGSQ